MADEFEKLADVLLETGQLDIAGAHYLNDWPHERLSKLLVYLSACGGAGWVAPLINWGADVNYVNEEGETALSNCVHARCKGNIPPKVDTYFTAIELLAHGADPNSPYLSLFSVTHLAMQLDQPDFVALFLLAGANPDAEEPEQTNETLRDNLLRGVADAASPGGWAAQLLALRDARVHG